MMMLLILMFLTSKVAAQEGPGMVTAFPGQDVELLCNVTGGIAQWTVNGGRRYAPDELFMGELTGHNISLTGRNIIVEDIMLNDDRNGSVYICIIPQGLTNIESDPTILLIAGVPTMVPGVTVDDNTIIINGNIVTLTLNWGEPFNNLDPIVNYIMSCSGDVTCPPNFTTNDNTTRSYTITNLTPMTNYTFSVVATNSIGSGEAGVLKYTTPAIRQVIGVTLTCEPVDLINQCTVMWEAVTEGNITGYQVYYNGTMMNVTSSTITLTFIAPLLPDGVFTGTVFVMVSAVNRFGVGPAGLASADINAITVMFSETTYSVDEGAGSVQPELVISNPSSMEFNVTVFTTDVTATGRSTIGEGIDYVSGPHNVTFPSGMTIAPFDITINDDNISENNENFMLTINTSSALLTGVTVVSPEAIVTIVDNDGDGNTGSTTGGRVGGIVGGVVGVVVGVGVTGFVVFAILFKKRKKCSKQTKSESDTGGIPLTSPTSPKVKPSETDSKSFTKEERKPTEGPTDEYAQVSKPAKQQQPKNTEVGINYAELDLQKGPKRFGNPDSTVVTYGEVTGTNQ